MKSHNFDPLFGSLLLTIQMIALLIWFGASSIPRDVGVCVGMGALFIAIVALSNRESARQQAVWTDAASDCGLVYEFGVARGVVNGRKLDVTIGTNDDSAINTVQRIEIGLKQPVQGQFVLFYAPRRRAVSDNSGVGAYQIQNARPPRLVERVAAHRDVAELLHPVDRGQAALINRLELRASKLVFLPYATIGHEDLGRAVELAGRIAGAIEAAAAALADETPPDDDGADAAIDEESPASSGLLTLNDHGARVVSRKP
jgi:hypothetical protein